MGGVGSGRYPKMDPAEREVRKCFARKRYNASEAGRLRRKLQRGGIHGAALDQAMHDLAPKDHRETQLLKIFRRDTASSSEASADR